MRARIIGKSSAARGRVTFPPFSCDPDIDEPTAAIGSIRLGHCLTRYRRTRSLASGSCHREVGVSFNTCLNPMQRIASWVASKTPSSPVRGGKPESAWRPLFFFGQVPAELLERAGCSVLFVAGEPSTSVPDPRNTSQEHPAQAAAAA